MIGGTKRYEKLDQSYIRCYHVLSSLFLSSNLLSQYLFVHSAAGQAGKSRPSNKSWLSKGLALINRRENKIIGIFP